MTGERFTELSTEIVKTASTDKNGGGLIVLEIPGKAELEHFALKVDRLTHPTRPAANLREDS